MLGNPVPFHLQWLCFSFQLIASHFAHTLPKITCIKSVAWCDFCGIPWLTISGMQKPFQEGSIVTHFQAWFTQTKWAWSVGLSKFITNFFFFCIMQIMYCLRRKFSLYSCPNLRARAEIQLFWANRRLTCCPNTFDQ